MISNSAHEQPFKPASGHVLVVGSVNMDVVTPVPRQAEPGETITAEDIALSPGGKGANAAVSAARMGARVRFAGCVGDDLFGRTLTESLRSAGVDCTQLRITDRATGTAVILLDKTSGQNSIMVGPGANALVEAPADPALYAWADVLMLQLETPVETNVIAARHAKDAGACVLFDPAPAVNDLPAELFELTDVLLPNESELAALTGHPVDSLEEAADAARSLLDRGVSNVVATLGGQGALWVTSQSARHFESIQIQAVDTTAAGDAFAGAFAAQLAEATPMKQAIEFAIRAGALTCTRVGAQAAIPTRQEVEQLSAR